MNRWGLTVVAVVAALTMGGCAADAPAVPAGATVDIVRTGGDMGIDDRLVIQADGSWSYTSAPKQVTRTGKLSADKIAEVRAIMDRDGFAQELAVPTWEARCIDPPFVAVTIGERTTTFVSCDDPRQKNMNDLLQLLLEEVYNRP